MVQRPARPPLPDPRLEPPGKGDRLDRHERPSRPGPTAPDIEPDKAGPNESWHESSYVLSRGLEIREVSAREWLLQAPAAPVASPTPVAIEASAASAAPPPAGAVGDGCTAAADPTA